MRIWVRLILTLSISLTEVELTSTTTTAESISTNNGTVQQKSACSRLALWRPWKVKSKADSYWTDGAKDTLSVTRQGQMRSASTTLSR